MPIQPAGLLARGQLDGLVGAWKRWLRSELDDWRSAPGTRLERVLNR